MSDFEITQCMGGWCRVRSTCANYRAPEKPGLEPAERLCGKVDEPLVESRDEEFKRKLAEDPRFATWVLIKHGTEE